MLGRRERGWYVERGGWEEETVLDPYGSQLKLIGKSF